MRTFCEQAHLVSVRGCQVCGGISHIVRIIGRVAFLKNKRQDADMDNERKQTTVVVDRHDTSRVYALARVRLMVMHPRRWSGLLSSKAGRVYSNGS